MTHWKRSPRTGLGLLALALALVMIAPGSSVSLAAGATIIYVDADATGTQTGMSWANAFKNLQDGLTAAVTTPAEIWVAEGTYKPTEEYGGEGERYKSFQLKNGVALYGGFDPSVGVGHDTFPERDWVAHPTILSGDLGTSGNNADNSYHVFYHPSGTNLDSTAILDGFTITGGNADGISGPESSGGGMYNAGSPTLTRCTFVGNSATANGGGMYNTGSPLMINCVFAGNSAGANGDGGGMSNHNSAVPRLFNSTFTGNSARDGGGMYNAGSAPQLVGCTFWGNSTPGLGTGGIINYASQSTTLTNCILWGNDNSQILSSPKLADGAVRYSDIQGGYASPGFNLNQDPLFVDPDGADNVVGTADDDLRLGAGSPVVNAGSNSLLPADTTDLDRDGNTTEAIPLDLDGYPRVVNGAVDMGAYERQNPPSVLNVSASNSGNNVLLTFAYAGEGVTYEVWRGAYPDFVVVSEGTKLTSVCKISGASVTCTLPDAITNPPVTSFYVVRASYAAQGGAFSDSNRTGMIGFILAPGD